MRTTAGLCGSLLFLIAFSAPLQVWADPGSFNLAQTITTGAQGVSSVYALRDLDYDGDIDLVVGSAADNTIAWYENQDGKGTFGPPNVITTSAMGVRAVYTAEVDIDSDVDIIAASSGDNTVAWYPSQLDDTGTLSFGAKEVITDTAMGATDVVLADIDQINIEGIFYFEVIATSADDDTVAWYVYDPDSNTFSERIITDQADGASAVFIGDLDGNGYLDVMVASENDDELSWYRYRKTDQSFSGKRKIYYGADGPKDIFSVDMDDDGDLDALSASANDNTVAWYENIIGEPGHVVGENDFGPPQVISDTALGVTSVYAGDLDFDCDWDVLAAAPGIDSILWYENTDQQGSFGPAQVVTSSAVGASDVLANDFDRDGDLDILAGSAGDHTVAWYRNGWEAEFINVDIQTSLGLLRLGLVENVSRQTVERFLQYAESGLYDGAVFHQNFSTSQGVYEVDTGVFTHNGSDFETIPYPAEEPPLPSEACLAHRRGGIVATIPHGFDGGWGIYLEQPPNFSDLNDYVVLGYVLDENGDPLGSQSGSLGEIEGMADYPGIDGHFNLESVYRNELRSLPVELDPAQTIEEQLNLSDAALCFEFGVGTSSEVAALTDDPINFDEDHLGPADPSLVTYDPGSLDEGEMVVISTNMPLVVEGHPCLVYLEENFGPGELDEPDTFTCPLLGEDRNTLWRLVAENLDTCPIGDFDWTEETACLDPENPRADWLTCFLHAKPGNICINPDEIEWVEETPLGRNCSYLAASEKLLDLRRSEIDPLISGLFATVNSVVVVPEPSSPLLAIATLSLLAVLKRRNRSTSH